VHGQIGNGTRTDAYVPAAVFGIASAIAVANGSSHSCAALADGRVACWGQNQRGQLGEGTTTGPETCTVGRDSYACSLTPVAVGGITTARDVAAGGDHSCALLADGQVMCWGGADGAGVGDGTTAQRPSPVMVDGVTNAVKIAAGYDTSCALLADRRIACWGSNYSGGLGDGNTGERHARVVMVSGIDNAVGLSLGYQVGCATLSTGAVKCWGINAVGQLGIGSTSGPSVCGAPSQYAYACSGTPVTVQSLGAALSTGSGERHNCAVIADRTVRCWGGNYAGQLGDGTTIDRTTPVAVD
jgi:alpha-tubulin suppressor-like RCC1 family protein